jgi:hypothetical protein
MVGAALVRRLAEEGVAGQQASAAIHALRSFTRRWRQPQAAERARVPPMMHRVSNSRP